MNIYINNEEVICSQKLTIKESLSNTSSVILNNVYPKSWELDRNYVDNFYMPKDYSHCVITDPNVTNEVIQETITYEPGRKNKFAGELDHCNINADLELISTTSRNAMYAVEITDDLIKIQNNGTSSITYYYINKLPEYGDVVVAGGLIRKDTEYSNFNRNYNYILLSYNWFLYGEINSREFYEGDPGEKVITTETFTNHILFNGFVKNSGNINLNPRYPHYSTLQLLDYKALLSEGATLDYVLDSQKVSEAIRKIVGDLEGFEVGRILIENDDTIKPYNCDQKTPYDVLEYLAEITGSRWITETKDEQTTLISFYSPGYIPTANQIEYTIQYFKDNNIQDVKYSYSAKDYRNKQTIVSDNVLSTLLQIERIISNGTINYQTNSKIGEIVSIVSGDTTYTAITNNEKEQGYVADFYYDYNSNKLTSENPYGYGKIFTISYYPVVTSRQVVYNQKEIDRINESTSRDGIIARYEKRTDTNNNKELNQIAQSYIDYKGSADITLTIQTHETDLLKIGQQVFFNGPLEDLKTNYLVTEKQTDMITTGDQQVLFYTYKLSSSFNDENAINFFDNQRRKLSGNIGEGEYITRYIDIPSTTNIIFYDLQKTEIETPGDILDGELDIELLGNTGNKLNAKLNFVL